jgi:hypothetical protein
LQIASADPEDDVPSLNERFLVPEYVEAKEAFRVLIEAAR